MSYQAKPMIRIIKVGGAAFTDKGKRETLNTEALDILVAALKKLAPTEEEGEGKDGGEHIRTILIHGAGSFGHFEANLQQGITKAYSQKGIALTRRSVTKLNSILVSRLVEEGLPAVSMSPFGSWETTNGRVAKHNMHELQFVLSNGLMPVLHGDVVMDTEKGCTILSGDTIAETIALALRPKFVVFITDVAGIYNIPPAQPDAKLLREIFVSERGREGEGQTTSQDGPLTGSGHDHDVTGGMTQKLWSANMIAASKIPVFIINSYAPNLADIIQFGADPEIGTTILCRNSECTLNN